MPRPRFFNLAPSARSRLLRIATKHFARRGLEGASLNEILAEAGISKGAYYYYFEDKDDLLATVLESAVDTLLGRLPMPAFDALAPAEFWPTVERFVANWAAAMASPRELFQGAVLFTAAQRQSARFAPILAKTHAIYRTLIEPGQRLGCVRRDLPADALVRLLEANDAALDSLFLASLRQHTALVFDTFQRLLLAATPTKRRSPSRSRRRR